MHDVILWVHYYGYAAFELQRPPPLFFYIIYIFCLYVILFSPHKLQTESDVDLKVSPEKART